MPNESVNLYLSIQSGSSEQTLVSLSDKTKALDKETQLLKQATDAMAKASGPLMEEQTKLQAQLKLSQKTVNDLQKAYDQYGDEMMKLDLDQAIENHAELKAELAAVNAQIGTNQKTYKEYLETVRKGGLSNPSFASLGGGDSGLNAVNVLAALGIGDKLSTLAQEAGGALLNSALGSDMGGLASGVLSSTLAGAAAGSIIPGIGTAVGAGVGALSGLISGGTKIFEAQDDAFKDYYGGLYDDVKGRSGEMVEVGSTIAGGREQTKMAFSRRLGGDAQADAYLSEVEKMAAKTNYDYDEIVGYAKLLLNSYKAKTEEQEDGTKETDVLDVLMALSDATAGLDLSSSDVNMMISGLSRMRTTGKATQEYLNYFRERGVDVDQALADSLNVDKSAIAGMVSKGQIGGNDAAQAILEFIQTKFGGLSDNLASTYDAMVDNLGDITSSLQAQGGDAYNKLRKEGVQAEMNALEGDLGDAIGEINSIIGKNQAMKENLQEQYLREALEAVLLGKEGSVLSETENAKLSELATQYAEWKAVYEESKGTDAEAAAQMESLYEQAQTLGQAYFDNSDFVKMLNDTELDEIDAIRENTAGLAEATQASYKLSQELSKGQGNAFFRAMWGETITEGKGGDVSFSTAASSYLGAPTQKQDYYTTYSGLRVPNSHAFGLERVPYNEYPALLHREERVLTASEARAQDAAQNAPAPIQIPITGNIFTGMPEEIADQIAEIIVRKLEQAAVAAAPK